MARNFRWLSIVAAALLFCACQSTTVNGTPPPPAPSPSQGTELKLPHVFSDNMVLQQGAIVPIWGWGADGEKVTVTFRGQKVSTRIKDGRWMVKLRDLKPGGPDDLVIDASVSIRFTNVLVGEVWVASGQSNMGFFLEKSFEAEGDIAAATNSMIRLLHVPKTRLDSPTNNVDASWTECSPATARDFSAVAYYFARDLQAALHVPVGIIGTYWGGTPAEAWTRAGYLESNENDVITEGKEAEQKYREKLAAKPAKPPGQPWIPGELYNGMIAPLIPCAIKGVIWYQGESNAGSPKRAWQYHTLFPNMIRNWRKDWGEGDFTFLAVQLAPFLEIQHQPGESAWASVREAQLDATKILPKVGMAVITDVGDEHNIHPTHKQPVGARLALAARGIAYNQKIEYSGPIFKSMKIENGKADLTFDHAAGGLQSRAGALKGFAIAGDDGKFVWALADIDGRNKVIVYSPAVQNPAAVRYGWANYPVVNLWNAANLPASPFRTDNFPLAK